MARNLPATSMLPGIYLNASHSRQALRTMAPSKLTMPSPAASARSMAEKSAFGARWPNCREPDADLLKRPSPMATLHSFAVTGPYGQACPPDQRRVVFRPVRDPVFDLGDLVAPLHLATHSANNRVTASTTYGLFVHQRGHHCLVSDIVAGLLSNLELAAPH